MARSASANTVGAAAGSMPGAARDQAGGACGPGAGVAADLGDRQPGGERRLAPLAGDRPARSTSSRATVLPSSLSSRWVVVVLVTVTTGSRARGATRSPIRDADRAVGQLAHQVRAGRLPADHRLGGVGRLGWPRWLAGRAGRVVRRRCSACRGAPVRWPSWPRYRRAAVRRLCAPGGRTREPGGPGAAASRRCRARSAGARRPVRRRAQGPR